MKDKTLFLLMSIPIILVSIAFISIIVGQIFFLPRMGHEPGLISGDFGEFEWMVTGVVIILCIALICIWEVVIWLFREIIQGDMR